MNFSPLIIVTCFLVSLAVACDGTDVNGGTGCTGIVIRETKVRASPNINAIELSTLAEGTYINILGRIIGTIVDGNSYWFERESGGYVPAVDITPSHSTSWCSSN